MGGQVGIDYCAADVRRCGAGSWIDDADAVTQLANVSLANGLSQDVDLPLAKEGVSGEHAGECGFTASVWSKDGNALTCGDFAGKIAQDVNTSTLNAEVAHIDCELV